MKSIILVLSIFLIENCLYSQNIRNQVQNQINNAIGQGNGATPDNDQIIKGVKEALSIGSKNASSSASKSDGFFKNPLIKIPFPAEAKIVETKARQFGMGSEVDKFVKNLNRAAEEASKEAVPIFVNAVKAMSITDGLSILKGGDNAATNFLKTKTSTELTTKFSPIVKNAINKVQLTKYWNPLIRKYNMIPGIKKMNPDLDKYVTEKALEGLFKLIAQEEVKIRKDPMAQVTDLLKNVFGNR